MSVGTDTVPGSHNDRGGSPKGWTAGGAGLRFAAVPGGPVRWVRLLVLVVARGCSEAVGRVRRFWSVLHYPHTNEGSAAPTRNGPLPRSAEVGNFTARAW